MPRPVLLAAIGSLLCSLPHALAAQTRACGAGELAAGDTTGAIAACERRIAADTADTESRYRGARIALARYLASQSIADRERASGWFDEATKLAPDSGKYWMGLAEVYRTYGDVLRRSRVSGLVDRAVEAAHAHGSGDLADLEFRAGVLAWERYEQLDHRYLFVGEAIAVNAANLMGPWRDLETFFRLQVKPDPGDPGAEDRQKAEERLRAALAADPRHVSAAGLLTVLLGNQDRWTEAEEVTTRLLAAAPDSGRAWAIRGLVLTRERRWPAAQQAFDTALARMRPDESAPYRNLGPILKAVDQVRFQEMKPAQQQQLASIYWAVSQPLFTSAVNEVKLEFFARLTYVIHRWSDPYRNQPGWASDRGMVFLRYGPPDIWASFGRGRQSTLDAVGTLENERNTIVWAYTGSELRFMFSMVPGFGRTTFGDDFRTIYDQAREVFPVRFDNVPAVAEMDTILVQFAQFRGEGAASTELASYSFMPIGRMARGAPVGRLELNTAALVRDLQMRDVQKDARHEEIQGGDSLQIERRSFRFELQPRQYLLRLEATLPTVGRSARSTSALDIRAYGTDSLMLSDVVVARRVEPRDSRYARWRDFLVVPSAGRFTPESPVGLLWEVYNLTPDSTGQAHYSVDIRITVRNVERKGFAARILGGIGDAMGLTARGDDAVSLTYDRTVDIAPGGVQPEYLTVELKDAPKAEYAITITVNDKVAGKSIEALRRIVVTDTELGAR